MPGQVRRSAYIHLQEEPADALFWDYYPDKQSLSGGTHIGTKSAPGWSSDVIHPRGLKSVDQKVSAIWNDYLDVKLPSNARPSDFCGAAFALQWIYDFLGPGADDDQSNVFVLKTFVKPEYVVVESWNADVMIVGPEGDVLRVRLDLGCKFYREVEVDSSLFPKKAKKGKKKGKRGGLNRAQLLKAAKMLGGDKFLKAQEFLQLAFAN